MNDSHFIDKGVIMHLPSTRVVTAVTKDHNGVILKLCGTCGCLSHTPTNSILRKVLNSWSPRNTKDVIYDIKNNNIIYQINIFSGYLTANPIVIVKVINDPKNNREYLRASANNSSIDNLDNLPPCHCP